MSQRPQNCGTGFCSCIECLFEDKPPTVQMLPRDQLADRLAFEKAVALVEAHGWRVVEPVGLGCEGVSE